MKSYILFRPVQDKVAAYTSDSAYKVHRRHRKNREQIVHKINTHVVNQLPPLSSIYSVCVGEACCAVRV